MTYLWLATAVLLVHLAFILFVVLGGLLAWRWPKVAWLHVPAVLWGAYSEFAGAVCPLTPWENALRRLAGESGYPGGFIEHYLTAAIYPEGLTREVQFALGAGVLLVNAIAYGTLAYWRLGVLLRRRKG